MEGFFRLEYENTRDQLGEVLRMNQAYLIDLHDLEQQNILAYNIIRELRRTHDTMRTMYETELRRSRELEAYIVRHTPSNLVRRVRRRLNFDSDTEYEDLVSESNDSDSDTDSVITVIDADE